MIDNSSGHGRIDLRAIDVRDPSPQADRVIAAAMARITANPAASSDVFGSILIYSRQLIAAAAVLVALAAGTLLTVQGRSADSSTTLVASWAQSSHVPTNAELLTSFQGYDR